MIHLLLIGFAFLALNALQKDTCYQVTWTVFGLNRKDAVNGANSYAQLYDRKAKRIQFNTARGNTKNFSII